MRYFLISYTPPSEQEYEVELMARQFSNTIAESYDELERIANQLLDKAKQVNPDAKMAIYKGIAGAIYVNVVEGCMIDLLFFEIKEQGGLS